MRTILSCLIAAIVVGSANEQPESAAATPVAVPSEAPVAAPPLTEDQQETIDWATDRFVEAGLELPEFKVRFDPTQAACNGEKGLYDEVGGRHTIAICQPLGPGAGRILDLRRTTLHELAHVWEAEHLSDAERAEATTLVGAERWIDGADEWEDRGIERFAETLVFGLYRQKHRPMLIDTPCSQLYENFRDIAGTEPIGPVAASCMPD